MCGLLRKHSVIRECWRFVDDTSLSSLSVWYYRDNAEDQAPAPSENVRNLLTLQGLCHEPRASLGGHSAVRVSQCVPPPHLLVSQSDPLLAEHPA